MKKVFTCLGVFVLCLSALPVDSLAQVIQKVEKVVEEGGSQNNQQYENASEHQIRDSRNNYSEGYFEPLAGPPGDRGYFNDGNSIAEEVVTVVHLEGFYYAVKASTFLLFGSSQNNPFAVAEEGGTEFSKYPYDFGQDGLFRPKGELGYRSRTYAGISFVNNERGLSGGNLQIRYAPVRAFSIELNHLQLFEKVEGQQELDLLGFSSLLMHYNRLRRQRIHLWWGLGLASMSGESNYSGPALQLGTTIFVHKPLSVHLEGQAMWFNGVPVNLFQARLQTHLQRFQVFAGYQGIVVNYEHFPSWVLGTGVYF